MMTNLKILFEKNVKMLSMFRLKYFLKTYRLEVLERKYTNISDHLLSVGSYVATGIYCQEIY